jgi:hypothetical protein
MARIPLQVGGRGLDTGSVVQYPSGSPVGAAIAGFGADLQNVASRLQQKQEQKDNFDLSIRENEFAADLARVEDEAVKNAAVDGSGLHDGVYGQIDPVTKQAVKPGAFDKVFDSYLERIPESKRAEFQAKRDVYRLRGSARMAQQQYASEQAYYKVEIQKTQNDITTAMAMADPNDDGTFESFKKQGLDIIDKSGLPALEKDVARENWLANADETLFKTKLSKDPEFAQNARAALGLAPPAAAGDAVTGTVNKIIGVESGGNADAKNPRSTASGLGQFTNSTWIATIDKHRPDMANLSRSQKLALKSDPDLGRAMTVALTQDNAEALARSGAPITEGNLYLAHFAGVYGAQNVLRAADDRPIVQVLGPAAVDANPFLKGKTVGWLKNWANEKMGQAKGGSPAADPRFANIPLDRRLVLANQADVQVNEQRTTAVAMQKAEYASYKDSLELQVVQGQIRDEQLISRDTVLNDGDKATLIRSYRSQNESNLQVQADLTALAGEQLRLDPYDSKDKTRADNLYSAAKKNLTEEQASAVASTIIQQTGVIPQPVMNDIRKGLSSTALPDVVAAAQAAQRIASYDPAVLARRDGGADVQKAAEQFEFYTRTIGMDASQAAQRLIDARDPAKIREREAILSAKETKDYLKDKASPSKVRDIFDPGALGFDPKLGNNEAQAAAISSEYQGILQESLLDTGGDKTLAEGLAKQRFQRLYGPSTLQLGGSNVIMRLPPEKTYPVGADGTHSWLKSQAIEALKAEGIEAEDVFLQPDLDTDRDFFNGKAPRYQLFYQKNGMMERFHLPFYGDVAAGKKLAEDQKREAASEAERKMMDNRAFQQEIQQFEEMTPEQQREYSADEYLKGPVQIPPPVKVEPPETNPTIKDKLDDRQDKLFENGPLNGGSGW